MGKKLLPLISFLHCNPISNIIAPNVINFSLRLNKPIMLLLCYMLLLCLLLCYNDVVAHDVVIMLLLCYNYVVAML